MKAILRWLMSWLNLGDAVQFPAASPEFPQQLRKGVYQDARQILARLNAFYAKRPRPWRWNGSR